MRRNYFIWVLQIVFIGLSILCCSKKNDSPSFVVKKFFTAIGNADTKTFGDLVTAEVAQKMIRNMDINEAKININNLYGIKNIEEKIIGDYALVNIIFNNGYKEKINLIKINGKWKIDIKDFKFEYSDKSVEEGRLLSNEESGAIWLEEVLNE
jgi:hypothetical protein